MSNPELAEQWTAPSAIKLPAPKSPEDLVEKLKFLKAASTHDIQAEVLDVFTEFTSQLTATLREQQGFSAKIQKQKRSPFDPDWDILFNNEYLPHDVVQELREQYNALRKLYSPVEFETKNEYAAVPELHVYLGTLKKLERICHERALPGLERVEALARRVELFEAEANFWAHLKITDDFAKISPEAHEMYAKDLINQNWGWDASQFKAPYF